MQAFSSHRDRKASDQEESAKMVELLGTVTDTLKQKTAATSDDHFTSQLLCQLKSIPDSREKEMLKIKMR